MIPPTSGTSSNEASSSDSSDVKILTLSQVDQKTAKEALERINNSVNGSHYTRLISNRFIDKSNTNILFAMKDNEIIGYITYENYRSKKKKEIRENPHIVIPFIAVDSQFQGAKGGNAALKLMLKVIDIAKNAHAEKLILTYRGNKDKTRKFYAKVGKEANIPTNDKPHGFYWDNQDPMIKKTFSLVINERKDE